jgi:lipoprotein NlpI
MAHFNRGVVFYYRGEYEKAHTDWASALSINPDLEAARNNLELLRQMGYEGKAKEADV